MFLAVNPIPGTYWAGELAATILFAIASIIGLIYARRVAKKKKPKPEDTLPPSWRDHFFS